ncbi:hypothetical protein RTCIAT899_CH03965 [Rhizobium tropici CIAT 899]|nr:hypothetical protein RTCIAT899_CH03965 [Rhizobium tropici CIAT 899]
MTLWKRRDLALSSRGQNERTFATTCYAAAPWALIILKTSRGAP